MAAAGGNDEGSSGTGEIRAVDILAAKRRGVELSDAQVRWLAQAVGDGSVPDYQVAAFCMAVCFAGMTRRELGVWTDAMLHSGTVLDLSSVAGRKSDKHSSGGVGDKVSLVLAPLAVCAGLKVPMISGRGLAHSGGTLDKLEAIPGFRVGLSSEEFVRTVSEVGCAIAGQTAEVAPADKKLYAIRDVTSTVDCVPLIVSSIMSKKLAEGIDSLVLDIKVGSGAFMQTMEQARELGQAMVDVGEEVGTPVRAMITDMNQPLGCAIGNALEVREAIAVLSGEGPAAVEDLTVALVMEMLDLEKQPTGPDVEAKLRGFLRDGSALAVFRKMVEAQGGDPRVCDSPDTVLPKAPRTTEFVAAADGYVSSIHTVSVGVAGVALGAGRKVAEDKLDLSVGMMWHCHVGAEVKKGTPIATIHHDDKDTGVATCLQLLEKAVVIADEKPEPLQLVRETLKPSTDATK